MPESKPPSAAQIRAARSLLGWSQQEVSDRAGVARRTLTSIETGDAKVSAESVTAVQAVLEGAGVVFVGSGSSEGVKRKS